MALFDVGGGLGLQLVCDVLGVELVGTGGGFELLRAEVAGGSGGPPNLFRPPRPSSAGTGGPKPPPPPASGSAGVPRRPFTQPPSPVQQQDSQQPRSRPSSPGPNWAGRVNMEQSHPSTARESAPNSRWRSSSAGPTRTEQSTPSEPSPRSWNRPSSAGPSRSPEPSEPPWYQKQPPPRPPSTSCQKGAMTRYAALACLGLDCISSVDPTHDEIRRAYKQAALRWHPDRQQNHGCAEEAKQRFQEVRAAFEVLQACVRSPAAAGGA